MSRTAEIPSETALARAFGLAETRLRKWTRATLGTAAPDPLRLDLSPLSPGSEQLSTPATLAALGALYFHAELERAGVLPTVEALVEARRGLALQNPRTADKLERFEQTAREHFGRAAREGLFARIFGLGPAARLDPRVPVNLKFMQLLLRLSASILRAEEDRLAEAAPSAREQARLRVIALALAENLAQHRAGNVLYAARRLNARLQQAFEILGDPGVCSLLGTRGAWHSLEQLSRRAYPNMRDSARRGAAGQRLLLFVGKLWPNLNDQAADFSPDPATVRAAAEWCVTLGVRPPQFLGVSA